MWTEIATSKWKWNHWISDICSMLQSNKTLISMIWNPFWVRQKKEHKKFIFFLFCILEHAFINQLKSCFCFKHGFAQLLFSFMEFKIKFNLWWSYFHVFHNNNPMTKLKNESNHLKHYLILILFYFILCYRKISKLKLEKKKNSLQS